MSSKRQMGILHVIPSLAARNGGPSFFQTDLAHSLLDHGVDVSIFATTATTPAQTRSRRDDEALRLPANADGLDIRLFDLREPARIAYSPSLGKALREEVRSFDLVHIHSLNLYPQYAAWKAATAAGLPYVVTPHGALDPYIRSKGRPRKLINDVLWQRKMLQGAAAIHVTSQFEAESVRALGYERISIIPIGINLEQFQPRADDAFRAKHLGDHQGPIILNHGRIAEKKRLDVLIEALPVIHERFPDARLVLIGADDEGQWTKLELLAASLGISEHVTRLDPLFGESLREAICAADVWALPSADENFGMAVLEAMAAGRPVIASPYINMAPDAAHRGALRMVENTSAEVARAAIQLLSNPLESEALGRAALSYASEFDWASIGTQFVNLYEQITIAGDRTSGATRELSLLQASERRRP